MTDIKFNISKGRTVGFYENVANNAPANSAFIAVLLKMNEADATLIKHEDLAALIADAGNTEADFTNYARKVLTDTELAAFPSPNHTSDAYELTFPDLVYTNAGGAANNTMTKVILCYDPDTTAGTDATLIPIGAWGYTEVTSGSTLTIDFPAVAHSST